MATHKLLLLPGDGIGPEVMAEVKRLIDWLNAQGIAHFETEQGLVGGAAYDASKLSITDATMASAQAGRLITETELTGERLAREIFSLLDQPREIETLSTNARSLAYPHAARDIVNLIEGAARRRGVS